MAARTATAPTAPSTRLACLEPSKEIVDRQIDLGVDIVNDGEYAKAGSYGGYIQDRITGYSSVPLDPNRTPKARRYGRARPASSSPASSPPASGSRAPADPIRPGFVQPDNDGSPGDAA